MSRAFHHKGIRTVSWPRWQVSGFLDIVGAVKETVEATWDSIQEVKKAATI